MANFNTIHNSKDYVNYVFNLETRGVAEAVTNILGVSGTVQNLLGNLAFKTSEYMTHAQTTVVSFGIAAAAGLTSATKSAIEFQQATANVEAISGRQLQGGAIGAQAMEMSNKFGMAITEMTEGLEALARAGITANESISALLESGVQMSKFEGTDLEDSINSLISTVNLLNPDLDSSSNEFSTAVRDLNQQIVSTSESSPINADNIMKSLQHIGGYASATGIDQDDLFAVIAQLGAKGTKGEITGTSLRAFVSAGQKDKAQRALDQIGLSVKDLWDESGDTMLSISQMKDVIDEALEGKGYSQQEKLEFYSDFVGYKQANQVMKIDTSEVEYYRNKINESMSLTEKMGIILGTVQNTWAQIANTAKNFMTKVGQNLLPIINIILQPIKLALQIIDKIPFGDKIVALGLGLVAVQGIAKLVTSLVPTFVVFLDKFMDFEHSTYNVGSVFQEMRADIEAAVNLLVGLKGFENLDQLKAQVSEREAKEKDRKFAAEMEYKIQSEIKRQRMGYHIEYVQGTNAQGQKVMTPKEVWDWDLLSAEAQKAIIKNAPEDTKTVDAFREHFIQYSDKMYQAAMQNKEGSSPSSPFWLDIYEHERQQGSSTSEPELEVLIDVDEKVSRIGKTLDSIERNLRSESEESRGNRRNYIPKRNLPQAFGLHGYRWSPHPSGVKKGDYAGWGYDIHGRKDYGRPYPRGYGKDGTWVVTLDPKVAPFYDSNMPPLPSNFEQRYSDIPIYNANHFTYKQDVNQVPLSAKQRGAAGYRTDDPIDHIVIDLPDDWGEDINFKRNPSDSWESIQKKYKEKSIKDLHNTILHEITHLATQQYYRIGFKKAKMYVYSPAYSSGLSYNVEGVDWEPGEYSDSFQAEHPTSTFDGYKGYHGTDAHGIKHMPWSWGYDGNHTVRATGYGPRSAGVEYEANFVSRKIMESLWGSYDHKNFKRKRELNFLGMLANTPYEMEKHPTYLQDHPYEKQNFLSDDIDYNVLGLQYYDMVLNPERYFGYYDKIMELENSDFPREDKSPHGTRNYLPPKERKKDIMDLYEKYKTTVLEAHQLWLEQIEENNPINIIQDSIDKHTTNMQEVNTFIKTTARSVQDAANAAPEYELAPYMAYRKAKQEFERMDKVMEDFDNDDDDSRLLRAYKKSISTSAMSEDAKEYAINKNRRNMHHFLMTGEQNKSSWTKNQWQNIVTKMQNATILDGTEQDYLMQDIAKKLHVEIQKPNGDVDVALEKPEKLLELIDALPQDLQKKYVQERFMQFAEEAATERIDTKQRREVNWARRQMIKKSDYENIQRELGLDADFFIKKDDKGTPTGKEMNSYEKFEALQDLIDEEKRKDKRSDIDDKIARILMLHSDKLAATMEQTSLENNQKFINFLVQKGAIASADLVNAGPGGSGYNLYNDLRQKAFKRDAQGNILDNEQQPIVQLGEEFYGGFAKYGVAEQYEMGLHLAEAQILLQRAGVNYALPQEVEETLGMPKDENEPLELGDLLSYDGEVVPVAIVNPLPLPVVNVGKAEWQEFVQNHGVPIPTSKADTKNANAQKDDGTPSTAPKFTVVGGNVPGNTPGVNTGSNDGGAQMPGYVSPQDVYNAMMQIKMPQYIDVNYINHFMAEFYKSMLDTLPKVGDLKIDYDQKNPWKDSARGGMPAYISPQTIIDMTKGPQTTLDDFKKPNKISPDPVRIPTSRYDIGADTYAEAERQKRIKEQVKRQQFDPRIHPITQDIIEEAERQAEYIKNLQDLPKVGTLHVETPEELEEQRRQRWEENQRKIEEQQARIRENIGSVGVGQIPRTVEEANERYINNVRGAVGDTLPGVIPGIGDDFKAQEAEAQRQKKIAEKYKVVFEWSEKITNHLKNTENKIMDTVFGTTDEEGNHQAGNRFSAFLDEKLGPYEDKFGIYADKAINKLDNFGEGLMEWGVAFRQVGDLFPPFAYVGAMLERIGSAASGAADAIEKMKSILDAMTVVNEAGKLLGGIDPNSNIGRIMQTIGTRIKQVLGKAFSSIDGMVGSIASMAGPLAIVAAAIIAVIAALKWSQSAHDEYLKKLKEEGETLQKEDQAAQISYENARKNLRARRQNSAQRTLAEEHYRLAEIKLEATNRKRRVNLLKQTHEENDALWGNHGMRASVQKTGWFESILSMGVPFMGTIAKALAGEFKSEVDEYSGTTGQIREIKEQTIGTTNIFGPKPTAAQKQAAAYYDAHRVAFATIDNYKTELGELYDIETRLIKGMGSKERARNSRRWNRELARAAKATGLTADQIEGYLDYMQIEHVTETAKNAMQSRADQITANAEMQALAIANGASVEDAMGLNGLEQQQKVMIQAQADMVRQQAADSMWWKAVWATVTSFFWQVMSPITLIVNILSYIVSFVSAILHAVMDPVGTISGSNEALNNDLYNVDQAGKNIQSSMGDMFLMGREGQKAGAYWNAYNQIQNEDFTSIGENAVSEQDRADYGNGGGPKTYMSTTTATPLLENNLNEGITGSSQEQKAGAYGSAYNQIQNKDSTSTEEGKQESKNLFTQMSEWLFGPKTPEQEQEEKQQSLADAKQKRMEEFNVRGTEQEGIWKAVSVLESIDAKLNIFGVLGLGMGGLGLLGGFGGLGGLGGPGGTHGIGSLKDIFQNLMNSEVAQTIKNSTIGKKAIGIKDKLKDFADKHGLDDKVMDKVKGLDASKIKEKLSNINFSDIKDKLSTLNFDKLKDIGSNLLDTGRGALEYLLPNTTKWASEKGGLLHNTFTDIKDKIADKIGDMNIGDKINKAHGNGIFGKIKDKINEHMPKYPLESYLSDFKLKHQDVFNKLSYLKEDVINRGRGALDNIRERSGPIGDYISDKVSEHGGRIRDYVSDKINGHIGDYVSNKAGGYGSKVVDRIKDTGLYRALSKDFKLNTDRLGGRLGDIAPTTVPMGKISDRIKTTYQHYSEDDNYTFGDAAQDLVGDHVTEKVQDRLSDPKKLKGDYKRLKNSKLGKKVGNSRVGKAASKGLGKVGNVASKGLGKVGNVAGKGLGKIGGKGIAKAGGKLLGKVAGKIGGRLVGMEIGAALGSVVPGLGTVIGAGIGWLAGELIGGGIEWLMNGGADGKDANGHKKSATRGNKQGVGGALSGFSKWVGGGLKKTAKGIGGVAKGIGDVLFTPMNLIGSVVSSGIGVAGKGVQALVSNHPMVKGIQALHSLTAASETKRAKDYAEGKALSSKIKDNTGETSFNVERIIEHLDGISGTGGGGSVVIKNININTADDPEAIKTALMNMIIELKDQVAPRTVGRTIGEPPSSTTTDTDTTTDPNDPNADPNATNNSTTGNHTTNYY